MRCVLAILFLVLAEVGISAEEDYFPLAVGDEWTMASAASIGGIQTVAVHTKIERGVMINGKTYVRLHTWGDGLTPKDDKTALQRKDDHGVYFIDEKTKDAAEQVVCALPLKVGDSWQRVVGTMTITTTVVGLETVSVPGRIYENCLHLRLKIPGLSTADSWRAPSVGVVKSETVFETGLELSDVLTEFKALRFFEWVKTGRFWSVWI
jgi:hypothetical protein